MEPKISVIIPLYNSESYIEKSLQSILLQTYKNFEVIIVNDGSTDDSRHICEKFCNASDKFVLIDQCNKGVDKARNTALTACTGDYITFSDSDDYADTYWLQSFVDAINKYPESEIIIEGLYVDYDKRTNKVTLNNYDKILYSSVDAFLYLERMSLEGFLFNKIYKRNIIIENHLEFEYTLKEDLLFNLRYFNLISKATLVSDAYYHYVQHGAQTLIHKRYPAQYMESLIDSIMSETTKLAINNTRLMSLAKSDYALSYSVLIFSLYLSEIQIPEKLQRKYYIRKYKSFVKENPDISIKNCGLAKMAFTKFLICPAWIIDAVMLAFRNIKESFFSIKTF
jgi:glycosyltransferase involved in cell wall biosynthesis